MVSADIIIVSKNAAVLLQNPIVRHNPHDMQRIANSVTENFGSPIVDSASETFPKFSQKILRFTKKLIPFTTKNMPNETRKMNLPIFSRSKFIPAAISVLLEIYKTNIGKLFSEMQNFCYCQPAKPRNILLTISQKTF